MSLSFFPFDIWRKKCGFSLSNIHYESRDLLGSKCVLVLVRFSPPWLARKITTSLFSLLSFSLFGSPSPGYSFLFSLCSSFPQWDQKKSTLLSLSLALSFSLFMCPVLAGAKQVAQRTCVCVKEKREKI